MKIGIVTTWNARCGICTYSDFLSRELQKLGIDIVILAERKDVLPKSFDPNFVSPVRHIGCWSRNEDFDTLQEEASSLIGTIRREKSNIVHIQHQFGLFPYETNLTNLLFWLKETNVKTVVTLHDVISYNPQMELYFGNIVKYSNKIIVHTNLCYDLMTRVWKCPKEKLVQITHGTKLIEVPNKKEARKSLGLPLDAEIILSWGFIWESKGLLEMVEIMSQLLKKFPRAIFIHAGGLHPVFSRRSYLRDIIKKAFKLGIRPENFKITGFINEEQIKLYFGSCDIIVLNYMRGSASASGAAHRALSAHRPIVGTDDPCVAEIPKLTVPRFDINSLYKGIVNVLTDKNLQRELVKKADKAALETSWKNIAKRHKEVFMSLMK